MDEKYWDKMGGDYDGEIFSVFDQDLNGVICSHIGRFGAAGLVAGDFALSVNVAIMMAQRVRAGIFRTIARHLTESGHLLLVVPSLESALLADVRLIEWNVRSGMGYGRAVAESLEDVEIAEERSLRQGAVEIEGVATKHYLKEEIEVIFADEPLDIVSIEKVEYSWKTEFEAPPRWMKGPYPWDWAVLLRKKGR